jgi:hypothetical protein
MKKVYSTLSFEDNEIKILVVDHTTECINCLYEKSVAIKYLDSDLNIINKEQLEIKKGSLIR